MQRSLQFLIAAGALVSIGISISFYAAQLNIEDIVIDEGRIAPNESFSISTHLDPELNSQGVVVVHVDDFKEDSVSARIFDPLGNEVLFFVLDRNPYQENFEIFTEGNYKIEIFNAGDVESFVIGAIGYFPEEQIQYLGYSGTIILVIGLVALVIVGIYTVKNRRKEKLN